MPTTASNPTVRIEQPAQLLELVRDCAERGRGVVDYGVAHDGLGQPPTGEHVRLELLGGVLEHYKRDLTVRAAAGVRFGQLQAALREAGQFLPIDADEDMSLGEIIHHNVYGPLRAGYGSVRDLVLGLAYADGLGRDIRVGGRTVKNVAGFDVSRFMVGSLGQFGVTYEATLRTYAIPEQLTTLAWRLESPAQLDPLVTKLVVTDAAPAALELRLTDDVWSARATFAGPASACAVQASALRAFLGEHKLGEPAAAEDVTYKDHAAAGQAQRAWRRRVAAAARIVVPPASTGCVAETLAAWAKQQGVSLRIEALPIHGCLWVGGGLSPSDALALDTAIAEPIHAGGAGFVAWHRRPEPAITPIGPEQSDHALLVKLKRTMDPKDILNPGRWIERISSQSHQAT